MSDFPAFLLPTRRPAAAALLFLPSRPRARRRRRRSQGPECHRDQGDEIVLCDIVELSGPSWRRTRRGAARTEGPEGGRGAGGSRRHRHRRPALAGLLARRRHDRRAGAGRGTISVANATIGAMLEARARRCSRSSRAANTTWSAWPDLRHRQARGTSRPSCALSASATSTAKVRRIGPTVEPRFQQGRSISASHQPEAAGERGRPRADQDRAELQRRGAAHRGAVFGAGTVVQVIKRDRVETKRVETGLMSGGQSRSATASSKATRRRPRRRAAPRGRSGAAGGGGGEYGK